MKWHKSHRDGGPECLGQVLSHCGEWRFVRRKTLISDKRHRYHWWIEHLYDPCDQGFKEWVPASINGIGNFRTLSEAKAGFTDYEYHSLDKESK